jgi:NADPH:quinone reductase-like Zn-dependent oxidoreductase
MKAIVQDRYGSPDVLELRDIDKPEVGDHDVLLRVRAAGVDPSVWHFTTGLPVSGAHRGRPEQTQAPRSRLCLWLLAKGVNVSKWKARASAEPASGA